MGYYSNVALTLTKNGRTILNDKLILTPSTLRKEVDALFAYADKHYLDNETQAEVWLWRNIKWYENEPEYYPHIQFVTEFLDSLDEEDYRFIHIGEDYDDTEVRGDFTENPFDLELVRGISLQTH